MSTPVYNNKVLCHLSMKLSDKFHPNQMHTSDKTVVKHISVKETLLKLDLQPKGQGHSKKQKILTKETKTCHKMSSDSLVTDVQLICKQVMNDLLMIIKVGQQRSRMTRLIIITARSFLASKTNFNLQFWSLVI